MPCSDSQAKQGYDYGYQVWSYGHHERIGLNPGPHPGFMWRISISSDGKAAFSAHGACWCHFTPKLRKKGSFIGIWVGAGSLMCTCALSVKRVRHQPLLQHAVVTESSHTTVLGTAQAALEDDMQHWVCTTRSTGSFTLGLQGGTTLQQVELKTTASLGDLQSGTWDFDLQVTGVCVRVS